MTEPIAAGLVDRLFLKPAAGLLVRKPMGGHLAAEGEHLPPESYWLRRITDGDVTVATAPVAAQSTAKAK